MWDKERKDWGDGWMLGGSWEGKTVDPEGPELVTQEISVLSPFLGSSVGDFLL